MAQAAVELNGPYTLEHTSVLNRELAKGAQGCSVSLGQAKWTPRLLPGAGMWSTLLPFVPGLQGDTATRRELAGRRHKAREVIWVGELGTQQRELRKAMLL